MINIAVFASGSGTNAAAIVDYLQDNKQIQVTGIYCNNPKAGVIQRSKDRGVECIVFDRAQLDSESGIQRMLDDKKVDLLVLAGFLLKIPKALVGAYRDRILNIHPALLPAYGGKGMYGMQVHTNVLENREKESGISIHLVNENYDEGKILFQARCFVNEMDTPEKLAAKIHRLEHYYYPRFILEYGLLKNKIK
jgi:phosphoribosylglycinamide formyltransferase 1